MNNRSTNNRYNDRNQLLKKLAILKLSQNDDVTHTNAENQEVDLHTQNNPFVLLTKAPLLTIERHARSDDAPLPEMPLLPKAGKIISAELQQIPLVADIAQEEKMPVKSIKQSYRSLQLSTGPQDSDRLRRSSSHATTSVRSDLLIMASLITNIEEPTEFNDSTSERVNRNKINASEDTCKKTTSDKYNDAVTEGFEIIRPEEFFSAGSQKASPVINKRLSFISNNKLSVITKEPQDINNELGDGLGYEIVSQHFPK